MQETWIRSLSREDLSKRAWLPTPVFLPGEFHELEEPGGLYIDNIDVYYGYT